MSSDSWLAIIASSVLITAYVTYNWDIIKKKVHPNTVSWALWSFISVLSFTSYEVMTSDWIMSALPVVTSLFCILTFFLTLHVGRFSKLAKVDIIVLALGIITSIVWLISRSATYANLILQGCYILAYIPTYRSVWKNPANEKFLPWFLWSSACIVNLFVVFSRWEGNWPALVYPINGVIQCTFISILALRKKINPVKIRLNGFYWVFDLGHAFLFSCIFYNFLLNCNDYLNLKKGDNNERVFNRLF